MKMSEESKVVMIDADGQSSKKVSATTFDKIISIAQNPIKLLGPCETKFQAVCFYHYNILLQFLGAFQTDDNDVVLQSLMRQMLEAAIGICWMNRKPDERAELWYKHLSSRLTESPILDGSNNVAPTKRSGPIFWHNSNLREMLSELQDGNQSYYNTLVVPAHSAAHLSPYFVWSCFDKLGNLRTLSNEERNLMKDEAACYFFMGSQVCLIALGLLEVAGEYKRALEWAK